MLKVVLFIPVGALLSLSLLSIIANLEYPPKLIFALPLASRVQSLFPEVFTEAMVLLAKDVEPISPQSPVSKAVSGAVLETT